MATLKRIACLLGEAPEPGSEDAGALHEVGLAHSPLVEEAGPGLVYLDAAGLGGVWGDDAELGRRLVRAAADRGLRIRVGIAGSRLAALVAARRGSGIAVVAPGDDREALASASLALLDLPEPIRTKLERWGLRTLGDLAALPPRGVFERLGSDGLRLQRLAGGEDPRPLRAWTPPPAFEESAEPGWTLDTVEPVANLLASLAERVADKLERRGLAADRLEWTCRLAGGDLHTGSTAPLVPTSDAAALVRLLRASLDAHPPPGPVEAVALRARPTRAAPAQASLTDRSRPNPHALIAILARLAALVGRDRVGVPVLRDSHRPDAVDLAPVSSPEGSEREDRSTARAALALRRLRPPEPARVTLTGGRPVHVRSERLAGAIVASAGPWRSSGDWWGEGGWARDEWDAEISDGTLCRLVHDGSAWWLEGVYD